MSKYFIKVIGCIFFVIIFVFQFEGAFTFADAFELPDTGQTKCYQSGSPYGEIPCANTGQDGAYNINPMSFTDNGNGTVTDNNTGLMWQQDDHSDITCNGANAYCDGLAIDGYSDWRVPGKHELTSLIDYSISYPGPTIDTVFFPTSDQPHWSNYWSTAYAGNSSSAWNATFSRGSVTSHDKDNADIILYCYPGGYPCSFTYYHNVRCVRGGVVTPSFTDKGNGTVADNNTGLVWQQGEPGTMTWGSALSYCEGLTLGGDSGWRLPNVKELESLTDDSRYPAIDTNYFPNVIRSYYWSATTYALDPIYAWFVGSYSGSVEYLYPYFVNDVLYYYDKTNDIAAVRCVSNCQYSISPTGSPTFPASGGNGSITVTTSGSCNWTTDLGDCGWVHITSGGSGTGNGTASYSVDGNTSADSRACSMTVAGQPFAVNQIGAVVAPSAATNSATAITASGVTLNGTVSAHNASTTVTFQYGLTASYGNTVTAAQSPVTGNANTQVSKVITGLAKDVIYHYRVKAVNSAGTTYGTDMTFTIHAPGVTTNAATEITSAGATLNGTVNANNASTDVTFEYGLTTSYGSTVAADQSPVTGSANIPVSSAITGLEPNRLYHYRVKGVSLVGAKSGADMTFITLAIPPNISTNAATSITATGATLNGTVNANNASTTVTFEYGLTTSYGNTVTAVQSPVTGNADTPVSRAIAGLEMNKTYHFRIKGVNSAGSAYGDDMTFELLPVNVLAVGDGSSFNLNSSTLNVPGIIEIKGIIQSTTGVINVQ
ncbi:MAG: DUF1566 domain-containing protein [Nitrospirae bacterium]|nr:DUF1566 domain-containing protein [Nitrospirota bacterium]